MRLASRLRRSKARQSLDLMRQKRRNGDDTAESHDRRSLRLCVLPGWTIAAAIAGVTGWMHSRMMRSCARRTRLRRVQAVSPSNEEGLHCKVAATTSAQGATSVPATRWIQTRRRPKVGRLRVVACVKATVFLLGCWTGRAHHWPAIQGSSTKRVV